MGEGKIVSIIIPTYNEETTIKEVLDNLSLRNNLEVIVVDGGSCDKTIEFAKHYCVKIIRCRKNRALQMNEGTRVARGDILLFLYCGLHFRK